MSYCLKIKRFLRKFYKKDNEIKYILYKNKSSEKSKKMVETVSFLTNILTIISIFGTITYLVLSAIHKRTLSDFFILPEEYFELDKIGIILKIIVISYILLSFLFGYYLYAATLYKITFIFYMTIIQIIIFIYGALGWGDKINYFFKFQDELILKMIYFSITLMIAYNIYIGLYVKWC